MKRTRTLQVLLSLLCLGAVGGGCQKWALSVAPGDITLDQPGAATVEVTLCAGEAPAGPNAVTVWGGSVPPPIRIAPALGWSEPTRARLDNGCYRYTFTRTVHTAMQYQVQVNARIEQSFARGLGPYAIVVGESSAVEEGRALAQQYRDRALRAYRLVIALRALTVSDRQAFLRGFESAYAEAGDGATGQEHVGILRQALECAMYEQGFEQGRLHVDGQVTNSKVQTVIRRTRVLSRGCVLGWKAGYIDGFVRAMLAKAGDDEEGLYRQAETMYNVLSPLTG